MGTTNQDVIIAVIIVTILFLLFAVFTVGYFLLFRRNQKQHQVEIDNFKKEFDQQLLRVQVEVQENTYRHIGKDLHDNVNQLLGTTKMLINVTMRNLSEVPETLYNADATLGKAITEVREVAQSLDSDWLKQFDFLVNLQEEVKRINSGEAIKASIDCRVDITMNPEEQIILFRIVQEAIQNAVRHAQPSRLNVIISNGQLQLEVKVINDGKPLPERFDGMGTRNMHQRAKLFGGYVHWQTSNAETIVTITLPIKQSNEN